jgi:methylene-tetrahydrofolate reductase-like protein
MSAAASAPHTERMGSLAAHLLPDAPRPARPRTSARTMYALHHVLARNPVWSALAAWLERAPAAYRLFTAAERRVKLRLFGCRMCGQCALPTTAYACPMTCPKQLRNGPCGGVGVDGSCEVYPGSKCVWLIAYERAEAHGRVADLRRLQRPIDQRAWGQSSWVNYWLGRDEGLWTEDQPPPLDELPVLPRSAAPVERAA